jgi:hypothetical protein
VTDDNRAFLGIPVSGEIVLGTERKEQRPLEDFAPVLQAVLDDETIEAVGWRQFTPYFNDGDECVFGVCGLRVWLAGDLVEDDDEDEDEDEDDDHDFYYGSDSLRAALGTREYKWVGRERLPLSYTGPDEARFNRLAALNNAIESGEFNLVLYKAFGDHASVIVRRTGIDVEFYRHD